MATPAPGPLPAIDVVCAGSPREMGLAQGEALRSRIHAARRALAELEAFRLEQPWWLPYPLFLRYAESKAKGMLAETLAKGNPAIFARLQGISAASGLRPAGLYLMNALEAFMASVAGKTRVPPAAACSAVAVRGSRSATGEPIIARNFDYLPLVRPFYALRDSRPTGGFRAIEFFAAPQVGAIDGINEKGLCVTYNYAHALDHASNWSPISLAITDALATCTTAAEAVKRIEASPRWGAGLLMLADAEGDIVSLELSSSRSEIRRPAAGIDLLHHTNHFQSSKTREVEVSPEAVFIDKAPRPLRGRRVLDSALRRTARFEELVVNRVAYSPEDLTTLMSDHVGGDLEKGSTICMHGDYWNTTATMLYFPRRRAMRISYTSACQAAYREFSL